MKQAFELPSAPTQQPLSHADQVRRLRQLIGVQLDRELLTTDDLRREYHFSSRAAVRMFLRFHQVPTEKRGRITLVDRLDFDAARARRWKRS